METTYLGTLVILTFGVLSCVRAPAPHSIFCFSCWGARDPSVCTNIVKCHHDEICYTDVHKVSSGYRFTKGCRKTRDCVFSGYSTYNIFGRRSTYSSECIDCCQYNACNSKGCERVINSTVSTTSSTSQTFPPSSTSQTTSFTNASTLMTTTAQNLANGNFCNDHEEDGVPCSHYDHTTLCHDPDPMSYYSAMARIKCPKYCGFCSNNLTALTTTVMSTQKSTSTTTTTTTTTRRPVTSLPTTLSGVTSLVSNTPQNIFGGNHPCTDNEDASFSCADWAKLGYCNAPTDLLKEITAMRCYKYCGFC